MQKRVPQWLTVNLPYNSPLIWSCNISTKDLDNYVHSGVDMGYQILKAWNAITYCSTFKMYMFENTPMWCNSMIRRADSPIFSLKLASSGVTTLADVYLMAEHRFKKHAEILDLGEDIDWLTYTSPISAIPSIWKIQLKDLTPYKLNDVITPMEYYISKISPSRAMYWNYIETKSPNKDACPMLWSTDLQDKIDEDVWNNLYLFIMRITISTKLRYFQYKVLNRTITTNTKRSRWDPNITPLCYFCSNYRETILHLLVHCKTIAPLWQSLEKWCKYHYKSVLNLSSKDIILNNISCKSKMFINLLILILKHYVYASKCKSELPTFSGFMTKVNEWYRIEKTIAYMTNNVNSFTKKWKLYNITK